MVSLTLKGGIKFCSTNLQNGLPFSNAKPPLLRCMGSESVVALNDGLPDLRVWIEPS